MKLRGTLGFILFFSFLSLMLSLLWLVFNINDFNQFFTENIYQIILSTIILSFFILVFSFHMIIVDIRNRINSVKVIIRIKFAVNPNNSNPIINGKEIIKHDNTVKI